MSEHAHTQIVLETYKVHKSAEGVRKLLKTLQWKKNTTLLRENMFGLILAKLV